MGHEVFIGFNVFAPQFQEVVRRTRNSVGFHDFRMRLNYACESGDALFGMIFDPNGRKDAQIRVGAFWIKQSNPRCDQAGGFKVSNPNAIVTCSCGESFAA